MKLRRYDFVDFDGFKYWVRWGDVVHRGDEVVGVGVVRLWKVGPVVVGLFVNEERRNFFVAVMDGFAVCV